MHPSFLGMDAGAEGNFMFKYPQAVDIMIDGDVEGDNISDRMSSAKSVRIEILESDKGIKYDDTCISELMIYGAIDEKR